MERLDLNAVIRCAATRLDIADLDLRDLPPIPGDRTALGDALAEWMSLIDTPVRIATRLEDPTGVLVTLGGRVQGGPSEATWMALADHGASVTMDPSAVRIRLPCRS